MTLIENPILTIFFLPCMLSRYPLNIILSNEPYNRTRIREEGHDCMYGLHLFLPSLNEHAQHSPWTTCTISFLFSLFWSPQPLDCSYSYILQSLLSLNHIAIFPFPPFSYYSHSLSLTSLPLFYISPSYPVPVGHGPPFSPPLLAPAILCLECSMATVSNAWLVWWLFSLCLSVLHTQTGLTIMDTFTFTAAKTREDKFSYGWCGYWSIRDRGNLVTKQLQTTKSVKSRMSRTWTQSTLHSFNDMNVNS